MKLQVAPEALIVSGLPKTVFDMLIRLALLGVDVRYIVTSFLVATAKYLYTTIYCGRGEAELYIKECKLGVGSDTSPCTKATANQFRLLLHAAAYNITSCSASGAPC